MELRCFGKGTPDIRSLAIAGSLDPGLISLIPSGWNAPDVIPNNNSAKLPWGSQNDCEGSRKFHVSA